MPSIKSHESILSLHPDVFSLPPVIATLKWSPRDFGLKLVQDFDADGEPTQWMDWESLGPSPSYWIPRRTNSDHTWVGQAIYRQRLYVAARLNAAKLDALEPDLDDRPQKTTTKKKKKAAVGRAHLPAHLDRYHPRYRRQIDINPESHMALAPTPETDDEDPKPTPHYVAAQQPRLHYTATLPSPMDVEADGAWRDVWTADNGPGKAMAKFVMAEAAKATATPQTLLGEAIRTGNAAHIVSIHRRPGCLC